MSEQLAVAMVSSSAALTDMGASSNARTATSVRSLGSGDTVLPALSRLTSQHEVVGAASDIGAIWRWLAADLDDLERALGDVGDGQKDLAWRAARYLLARPGKRIRPVCVALAARIGGRGFDAEVREAAVACELVHTATLLHDDVVDEGDLRRGSPAARRVYGNSASVLGGDHLLVDALLRVDSAVPSMRAGLLRTMAQMVQAEALQLERRRRFEPDRATYLAIARGKTASLFRWAMEAGGALGHLDTAGCVALGGVGEALGVAFQLIDDTLDLAGDPATTGKSACTDLREGKLTWPLIVAGERSEDVAARLRYLAAADGEITAEVAADLVKDVLATGAVQATICEAERHAEAARAHLRGLPNGRAQQALSAIVEAAVARRK